MCALGALFFAEAGLPGRLDASVAEQSWRSLLGGGFGAIWAIEDSGGSYIGGLGALIYPDMNDGRLVATEAFWYVRPECRGGGLRLLQVFEDWAKARGVSRLMMVHLQNLMPESLSRLYVRRGYRPLETHYMKEL
jgi:GNAT superfamily N-acetyltransferase